MPSVDWLVQTTTRASTVYPLYKLALGVLPIKSWHILPSFILAKLSPTML